MAYFVDRNQMKVINFIPVRMVGSQPGSLRGLGALGGYEGDRPSKGIPLDLRFRGTGVSSSNARPVLDAIRAGVIATGHFELPSYLGWGTDGTLVYRGEVRSSNYTLGEILGAMERLARAVTQQTGKQVRVVRVSYTNVPSRSVEPAGDSSQAPPSGEGLMSRMPPPEELMSMPPRPGATPGAAPRDQNIPVRELQQRLNAAGARPRLDTDNKWGNSTKSALEKFAQSQGITLPAFDSGPSYRRISASEVTIPGALEAKLPEAGASGDRPAPRRRTPSEPASEPSDDAPPTSRDSDDSASAGGGIPWTWIGAAVAGIAAVALVFTMTGKKPARARED